MTHSQHHPKRRHGHHATQEPLGRPMPDGAVYIGLTLIGAFAVLLGSLALGLPWQHLTLGYVMAMMLLINFYAWRAYMGRELAPWQRALARVPLRFAGFGPRAGRPFAAARRDDKVRLVLIVSLAASSIVIAGAALILIR